MTGRAFSVALLVATIAVNPTPSRAQVTRDGDVRAAMTGFMSALNALDVDGMAGFFAPNVTAFVPLARAERVEGKDALVGIFRAFVERTRPTTTRLNLVPEDLEVVGSGPMALVTFNVRDTAGGLVRRRTFIWERSKGQWLIRHMHASDLAPPSALGGDSPQVT